MVIFINYAWIVSVCVRLGYVTTPASQVGYVLRTY